MTEKSQNGWPVLERPQLVWFTAAGGRFAAATADVAYLAGYLIGRFNAEVEPIAGLILDDWSYADRNVTGSKTDISNHASATAWDLNALKHQRGAKGTFTPAQIAAVRSILSAITDNSGKQIFRWGADYHSAPVDSMHFEINATPAQVKQARAKLTDLENDVSFHDQHTLTDADVAAYADKTLTAGKSTKSYDELVRFPPSVARLRREQAARDAALVAQLAAIAKAVAQIASRVGVAADLSTVINGAAAATDDAGD